VFLILILWLRFGETENGSSKELDFSKLKIFFRRREFSNSAWNIADVILLPFLMLLFTPFFIKNLGTDQYGIWMFVNSIIASIGIVNMGLGDASIKFVSKYRALNDTPNINRIVNTTFSLSLFLLLIIILLGIGVAFSVENFNLFNLNDTNRSVASSAIQLGSIIFGLRQIEQVILATFRGYERYDNASQISMTSKTVLLFSQIITVYLGYHLVELYTVSVISSTLMIVGEIIFSKFKYRKISFFPTIKRQSIKEIFSFSSWSWTQSVMGIIVGHVDRLIIITLAGPTFLAYYALASTVGTQIHTIFTASVSWVFPKVSGKTERKEDLASLYYKMQLLIIILGTIAVAILILFEYPIFYTWLGTETYTNSILYIRLFLFLAFFNMLSIIPYYFLLGANLIRISALFMFISVVFTIGFMIAGYHITDVEGLAYGKFLASLVSIPLMLMFVHYKIIDKVNIYSGLKVYLPSVLIAISIYFFNLVSIPLFIGGVVLLWFLYKERVLKTSVAKI